jgi:hypothetical protein
MDKGVRKQLEQRVLQLYRDAKRMADMIRQYNNTAGTHKIAFDTKPYENDVKQIDRLSDERLQEIEDALGGAQSHNAQAWHAS